MGEIKNRQIPDSVDAMELTTPSGNTDSTLHYMGFTINRSNLYSKDALVKLLDTYGGLDSTLDKVRDAYAERFGNQLIWKYPFSDSMQGGGIIVPIQEGFLFLPYNCVFEHGGARYQLRGAELLSAEDVRTLQKECRAYTDGLLSALRDMEHTMQACPVTQCAAAQENRSMTSHLAASEQDGADTRPCSLPENELRQYVVTIEEHISQAFPVTAGDISAAMEAAEKQYYGGSLVVQLSQPAARLMMAQEVNGGEETEWREF